MRRIVRAIAVAATGIVATLGIASAAGAAACGPSGYSYAGVFSAARGHGVGATLTALSAPEVESGHIGAWVGIGGVGLGPGGTDMWLQVGLAAFPGTSARIYYEVTLPGERPRYVEVAADVPTGSPQRLAVLEVRDQPDTWRVWVNGAPASDPIVLPGSSGAFAPIATAESWDGGRPACNRYAFRFERVTVAARPGGRWRTLAPGSVLEDDGYAVEQGTTPASFVATMAKPRV